MNETITLFEAFNVSLVSMIVITVILYILTLLLDLFKALFVKKMGQPLATTVTEQSTEYKEDDNEERIVVALAAAAIAGKDIPDGNFHIKRMTRIK